MKTCISAGATFTTTDFAIGHACYNRGTMHVTNMNNYYNSIFYNEGTVKVDNSLSVENWNTQLVNAGTMTAASLTTAGGGHVLNLDSMKISGTTTVNSNNCTWQNDGSFQTGDFNYTAGSTNVINNCKMVVDDTFRETLGDTDRNCFMMDGNASVVTKNLYLSIGYIKMGSIQPPSTAPNPATASMAWDRRERSSSPTVSRPAPPARPAMSPMRATSGWPTTAISPKATTAM